jgi:hypothetical protein
VASWAVGSRVWARNAAIARTAPGRSATTGTRTPSRYARSSISGCGAGRVAGTPPVGVVTGWFRSTPEPPQALLAATAAVAASSANRRITALV